MTIKIKAPRKLDVAVKLPASKSLSNRVLVINALSGHSRQPNNLSDCDDTFVMIRALSNPQAVTDIMAAGTSMRFLTAMFAATERETTMTGTARMLQRPVKLLVDALRQLGAHVDYCGEEGFPPIYIKGVKLEGGEVSIEGNVSSQFTSALLMIGPTMKRGLRLVLTGRIISRPYIEMTLSLMRDFGADVQWIGDNVIEVAPKPYVPHDFTIENDWSAASYWYEMMALASDAESRVVLPGLFNNSLQGDQAVAQLFEPLGVVTRYTADGVELTKGIVAEGDYVANLESQPDLAQTVVVTCAMMGKPFRISGLSTLRIKETDRLTALRVELAKFGIDIVETTGDTLSWDGHKGTAAASIAVDTYADHRMAMAFAPCAMRYEGMGINDPHVVSKSYPHYWDDLAQAGFNITENE